MDFRTDARLAQFGFLLGWQALSAPPVTWKPGDEFEAARKKSIGHSAPYSIFPNGVDREN
jgi:hypothetical protein